MKIVLFIACFFFCSGVLQAQKLTQKGLSAMQDANFGLAKQYFQKEFKKDSCAANFGMACFYTHSFFYQADSAYFYLNQTKKKWAQLSPASKSQLNKFLPISDSLLTAMSSTLGQQQLKLAQKQQSIDALDQVLVRYGAEFTFIANAAAQFRDSLAFENAKKAQSSSAIAQFLKFYPQAAQIKEANALLDLLLYQEQTSINTEKALQLFIAKNPQSAYLDKAWARIYAFYQNKPDYQSFAQFIQSNPTAPKTLIDDAWKQIYKRYMQPYSAEKLAQFSIDFPSYPFAEDLASDGDLLRKKLYPFVANNLYGYMDAQGKQCISAQYDEASAFHNNLAIVAKNDWYGLINKKNERIQELKFIDISVVKSGYIAEDSLGYYLLNFQGKKMQETALQWEELQQTLLALEWQNTAPDPAPVSVFEKWSQNGKFGLKKGNKVILPAKYDEVCFKNESDPIFVKSGKSLLYFDSNGKKLELNGLEWFANAAELASFSANNVAVYCKAGKFGLIDKFGKMLVKNNYEAVLPSLDAKYPFQQGGKWGVLGVDGKVFLPFQYESVLPLSPYGFLIEQESGLGLYDLSGKFLIKPEFTAIKPFENDCFLVENDNGLGLLNKEGAFVLPCAYQRIVKFDDTTFQLTTANGLAYFLLLEQQLVQLQP